MGNIKKELANTKHGQPFEYLVERGKIKEFANAIGDRNSLYRDLKIASERGLKQIPVPVTFPVNHLLQVDADNIVMEMMQNLDIDPTRGVHGSCEFVYEREIFAGETFKGEFWIGNIYEKEGKRGGNMTFVEMEVRFFDEHDKPAFLIRNVFIERGKFYRYE